MMTDLTYCHNHMTDEILGPVDVLAEESDEGELSDDELEIPSHAIPPNPDDYDALPLEVHPSYPYGDPTSLTHPATLPYANGDPISRALYEDMIYLGASLPINATLRWKELALDHLLPIDEEKAEATRASLARRTAAGSALSHNAGGNDGAPEENHEEQSDAEENSVEQGEEDD